MSKLAIIAIVGVLALAATADIAALEWSFGFRKSIQALISLVLLGTSLIVIVSKNCRQGQELVLWHCRCAHRFLAASRLTGVKWITTIVLSCP
jgi:hypothetical protein